MKIPLKETDNLFILTGAGISAESGLSTFRDSGGLWEGHDVREVASPAGWQENPSLVWDFYSKRRQQALAATPNAAHRALAAVENSLGPRFFLCTQNVDDLHERAGSHRVSHIHGNLFSSRCTACSLIMHDAALHDSPNALPRCEKCGAPMRPDIVWFGENLMHADEIQTALERATIFVAIGTSGQVFPAAAFAHFASSQGIPTHYIGLEPPENANAFDHIHLGPATALVPKLLLPDEEGARCS